MLISQLQDKKICILWFGKEGKSTYNFLLQNNITSHITIADDNKIEDIKLEEEKETQETEQTKAWTKEVTTIIHDDKQRHNHLDQYDIIIRTAGMPPHHPLLVDHQHKITSQTQIFFDNYQWKTIAVTGTKGKSTTSSLIHHILQANHTTALMGNIGQPILSERQRDNEYDFIILELSSFQLTDTKINPTYSIITNLLEDHIDRHGSKKHYHQQKTNIIWPSTKVFAHYTCNTNLQPRKNQVTFFGKESTYSFTNTHLTINTQPIIKTQDIPLMGDHNYENTTSIIALLDHLWHISEVWQIQTFSPLPHRLQKVATKKEITFYNDSQSTNPSTAITAIKTFGNTIGTLMLWWYQSHFDYQKLIDIIHQYDIPHIILFPDTISDFEKLLTQNNYTIHYAYSMKEAITIAYQHTPAHHICLLSPAAKSFSLRNNVYHRGDEFIEQVLSQA